MVTFNINKFLYTLLSDIFKTKLDSVEYIKKEIYTFVLKIFGNFISAKFIPNKLKCMIAKSLQRLPKFGFCDASAF